MQEITADMMVSGFRLIESVGIGTVGEVWRGVDDNRQVAVKFLSTTLLQQAERDKHLKRFQIEALALKHVSNLQHIPTHIHDEMDVERPYIVMDFIESPSFAEIMIAGEMMYTPLALRLNALTQIAETIQAVHNLGIVHRDIKPSNLRGLDYPYLLDFSIAMPMEKAKSANPRVGTPLYQTPDMLPPSHRTDNYAFAVVVYELLFGRHPLFDYRQVPDNAEDLRQQAGEAILGETWYCPNKLDHADLPINLQGADLDQLTMIFQNALMLSEDRYGNAIELIRDVINAIDIPSNQAYIDQLPLPTDDVGVKHLEDVEHFTDQLVAVYSASTDLPIGDDVQPHELRPWLIGLGVLFSVIFLIVVLLIFAPT